MTFAIGVRPVLVISYCIILIFGQQTVAFRIPGLQDLLQFAEIFPQNTVTHPPEEEPLTRDLCNLKTVYFKEFKSNEKRKCLQCNLLIEKYFLFVQQKM